MPTPTTRRSPGSATSVYALEKIVTIDEAAEIAGISRDSIRRHHSHLIRRLSPRRVGLRLRDVLQIGVPAE
jgi:hypothetical protein